MPIKLLTVPAAEPISTAEAKLYLRVSGAAEDSLIALMIKAARQQVEEYIQRSLITQTWDLFLDSFPSQVDGLWWDGVVQGSRRELFGDAIDVEIPRPPLISIVHVKTFAPDDTASTFAATNYTVDTVKDPGRIVLKIGSVWPSDLRSGNAVNIQFTAGYGTTGATVPSTLIMAMNQILGNLYEHRGDETVDMPDNVKRLLNPYQVYHIGEIHPTQRRRF